MQISELGCVTKIVIFFFKIPENIHIYKWLATETKRLKWTGYANPYNKPSSATLLGDRPELDPFCFQSSF